MKKLEFKIDIAASRKKVWDTMLNPETYKEWVNISWPGSYYAGSWEQGEKLRLISPGGGGTLTTIVELRPSEFILANHIAVINPDGTEDRNSEFAKSWIDTIESYTFTENNGETMLNVGIDTTPEWRKMFTDGWPNALLKLKEICEN